MSLRANAMQLWFHYTTIQAAEQLLGRARYHSYLEECVPNKPLEIVMEKKCVSGIQEVNCDGLSDKDLSLHDPSTHDCDPSTHDMDLSACNVGPSTYDERDNNFEGISVSHKPSNSEENIGIRVDLTKYSDLSADETLGEWQIIDTQDINQFDLERNSSAYHDGAINFEGEERNPSAYDDRTMNSEGEERNPSAYDDGAMNSEGEERNPSAYDDGAMNFEGEERNSSSYNDRAGGENVTYKENIGITVDSVRDQHLSSDESLEDWQIIRIQDVSGVMLEETVTSGDVEISGGVAGSLEGTTRGVDISGGVVSSLEGTTSDVDISGSVVSSLEGPTGGVDISRGVVSLLEGTTSGVDISGGVVSSLEGTSVAYCLVRELRCKMEIVEACIAETKYVEIISRGKNVSGCGQVDDFTTTLSSVTPSPPSLITLSSHIEEVNPELAPTPVVSTNTTATPYEKRGTSPAPFSIVNHVIPTCDVATNTTATPYEEQETSPAPLPIVKHVIPTCDVSTNTTTTPYEERGTSPAPLPIVKHAFSQTMLSCVDLFARAKEMEELEMVKVELHMAQSSLNQEISQRQVAEQLVKIVQSDLTSLTEKNMTEVMTRLQLENEVADSKAELSHVTQQLKEREEHIQELEDTLKGTTIMVSSESVSATFIASNDVEVCAEFYLMLQSLMQCNMKLES